MTLLALAPFTDKAFHIDDPLFLWAARQIQASPSDFYGFRVNWYGFEMAMAEVTKNPPLTSYYIALATEAIGWTERALHVAFLAPALVAVLGIGALARPVCARPLLATLAAVLTPVFLVSATNVMSDVLLVAFWVWAVVTWMKGIEERRIGLLMTAGVLCGLAALTKYFGLGLVPLLLVFAMVKRRRIEWWWALPLALPLVVLAAYDRLTLLAYGQGLVLDAAFYASGRSGAGASLLSRCVTTLSFAGGGLAATAAFAAPLLWSRRALAVWAVLVAGVTLALPYVGSMAGFPLNDAGGVRWIPVVQLGLFVTAGLHLVVLAAVDLWERRDASSLLLACWIAGTLAFTGALNWTVNARSILPMAPAAGLLLVRRLETGAAGRPGRLWAVVPVVAGAGLALAVTWADYRLADTARAAAATIRDDFGRGSGVLWFQGHWGFQYYMEAAGGRPIDVTRSRLAAGDVVVLPFNNTNLFPMPAEAVSVSRMLDLSLVLPVTTMSRVVGAGFYSSVWGPLPFALGPVPPERYEVLRVHADLVPRSGGR